MSRQKKSAELKIDSLPTEKTVSTAFAPIARADARVLVLGSMPGVISLDQQQYYAHPRNAFWPAMQSILDVTGELDYDARCQILLERQIAVWDVLQSCHRPGSLDSKIDMSTVVCNDFAGFLQQHPSIRSILFNGRKAQSLFRRFALPTLGDRDIDLLVLPSTSPAMASMDLATKTAHWRAALLPALQKRRSI